MFEYLTQYHWQNYPKGSTVELWKNNMLYSLDEGELENAEKILGFQFPNQLRQFYKEIGYGHLTTPHQKSPEYHFHGANTVLPPDVVVNFYQGKLEWTDQRCYMSEDTYEFLKPGSLPFFEIADSSRFLIMKLHSDNPNAVWSSFGTVKIEDSFEKFIWRMYYEDPGYYDDIIEKYYAEQKS